jgi:ADP-heptose:LPS heptosyltransferase
MPKVRPRLEQVRRRSEEVRFPGERFESVRRVLVARRDRLGDFVLTLPAFAALRDAYPDALFGLLVSPEVAPLAACVAGVDQVHLPAGTPTAVARAIAEFDPDLLICVARDGVVARSAWRAGVPRRVGPGLRFYSPLFQRRVAERRRSGDRHEAEYALSFAHSAGARGGPARFPLVIPRDAHDLAVRWLRASGLTGRFALVHPGSGGSCPRWPLERYAALVEALERAGVPVVVSLGPGEGSHSSAFPTALRYEGGLGVLTALASRAAVVVSNSTGPLHLAAALQTPTLAIHAPWRSCGPGRWGPYADNGWALVASCDEADSWGQRERARLADNLMAGLSPGTVLRCVRQMLDGELPSL